MTSRGEPRRKSSRLVLFVPLVASVATLIVTETSLSGPTAIHWTVSGDPDDFVSPRTAWAVTGGVGFAAGLIALAASLRQPDRPGSPGSRAELTRLGALGVGLLFAGLSVLVTGANLGEEAEPRLPLLTVAALMAACLLAFVAAGPTTRSGRLDMRPTKAAGADVLWEGHCRSRFAIPSFLAFVAAGVLLGIVANVYAGALLAVAGVFVLSLVEITVLVTTDAVRVCYSGPLRWPSTTIRLADVAGVEAIHVEPMRYGGWGYRGSLRLFRRAAVNLRRGPGLRFSLREGRVFVVTVDHADGAVASIEDLVDPLRHNGS
jgi:hypothetical protein